jgi:predicted TIM-barrel fold metal-dependent hydrolase
LATDVIDCDIHPAVPGMSALLPFMDDYWREQVKLRAIDALEPAVYRPNAPLAARPDWRPASGKPGASLEDLRTQVLDGFNIRYGICNVLYGGPIAFNAYLGTAICKATNDWLAAEWLDKEPRLRGSIVVPVQDPDAAAAEIERWAADKRFVQVLLYAGAEMPLGRRYYWPIYRAAERHGLPIAIHPGSQLRFAPSNSGWPSYSIEDYALQAQAIQGQLLSLIYEGVFREFPKTRVVVLESGVTWLPSFLWRADDRWRALRMEVPWVERSPTDLVREHVRFTVQPLDAPRREIRKILSHLGPEHLLLFATDYPHWHFDGDEALPEEIPEELRQRILVDNALAIYPRLSESAS